MVHRELRKRKHPYRRTETDFKPPPAGIFDWREELYRFLIAGGITGHAQNVIIRRMQNMINAPEIMAELEALLVLGAAQRFNPPATGRGRPPTIWRATDRIYKVYNGSQS